MSSTLQKAFLRNSMRLTKHIIRPLHTRPLSTRPLPTRQHLTNFQGLRPTLTKAALSSHQIRPVCSFPYFFIWYFAAAYPYNLRMREEIAKRRQKVDDNLQKGIQETDKQRQSRESSETYHLYEEDQMKFLIVVSGAAIAFWAWDNYFKEEEVVYMQLEEGLEGEGERLVKNGL